MPQPVLEITDLSVEAPTRDGWVTIVNQVDLSVNAGETLGLVGESGSGKSMTSLAIMRLLGQGTRISSGSVKLLGRDLVNLPEKEMREVRGEQIGMIFQEPMTALDPAYSVGDQIAQGIRVHKKVGRKEAFKRAVQLLDRVGIPSPASRANDYPHHFSGGMRQRVVIAIALACSPKLILADEPTTALDVTVQDQILGLLKEIQAEDNLAVVFISHDMGVIADVCDRVNVMYAGQIVESAPVDDLFARPQHPYTEALLASIPSGPGSRLQPIPGTVPTFDLMPTGCRFEPRCKFATADCTTGPIVLSELWPEHAARCIHPSSARIEVSP